MAYVVTAAISLAVGALCAWLYFRKSGPSPLGAPTSAEAQIAISSAGAAAAAKAQVEASRVEHESTSDLDARVAELRARGRSGK